MGEKEMGHTRPRHQGGQNKEQYGKEEAWTRRDKKSKGQKGNKTTKR